MFACTQLKLIQLIHKSQFTISTLLALALMRFLKWVKQKYPQFPSTSLRLEKFPWNGLEDVFSCLPWQWACQSPGCWPRRWSPLPRPAHPSCRWLACFSCPFRRWGSHWDQACFSNEHPEPKRSFIRLSISRWNFPPLELHLSSPSSPSSPSREAQRNSNLT